MKAEQTNAMGGVDNRATIKLDKAIRDRLKAKAKACGLTLVKYLDRMSQ